MANVIVKKSEVNEVIANLNSGNGYETRGFQMFMKVYADHNEMYVYDKANMKYKQFYDINAFARAIVRIIKRGY